MRMMLTIPGTPVGKGRPRVTRYGTYTPKKTKEYEELVRSCWKSQSGETFPEKVPLYATIMAYFPIPKSVSKKRAKELAGTFHVNKPDADNVAKAILDSLNGFAFHDDSAVQIDGVYKVYTSMEPCVELTLEEALIW